MRLYMSFRETETAAIAAAKAGFSAATAYPSNRPAGCRRKSKRRVVAGDGIRWPQCGTARWCRC
jgi:hypothetical protein